MLPATKQMLEDERIWGVAARVAVHRGEVTHFALSEGQLHVSLITLSHNQEIWALLQGAFRSGAGMWRIPDVGTEVFVMWNDGDFEGDGYIAGFYGQAPDNMTENVTLILDGKVKIMSPGGVSSSIPTMEDLQRLYDYVNAQFSTASGHTHAVVGGSTTTITLAPGAPMPPDDPVGTSVLEAE